MAAEMHTTWEAQGPDTKGAWLITHTDYFGKEHQVWLTGEDAQALARDILGH